MLNVLIFTPPSKRPEILDFTTPLMLQAKAELQRAESRIALLVMLKSLGLRISVSFFLFKSLPKHLNPRINLHIYYDFAIEIK